MANQDVASSIKPDEALELEIVQVERQIQAAKNEIADRECARC